MNLFIAIYRGSHTTENNTPTTTKYFPIKTTIRDHHFLNRTMNILTAINTLFFSLKRANVSMKDFVEGVMCRNLRATTNLIISYGTITNSVFFYIWLTGRPSIRTRVCRYSLLASPVFLCPYTTPKHNDK